MPQKLTNKTIEFKLPPSTIPTHWLRIAERIWNDGLDLLNWRQHWLRVVECGAEDLPPVAIEKIKQGDNYYLHCWIGRDRRIDRSKSYDRGNIEFVPQVRLVRSQWQSPPPIEGRSAYTLCKRFTRKVGYDYGDLPSGMVQTIIHNLAQSWDRYIKTGAGKPKYRGRKNPIESLGYDGFRNFCKLDGDRVKLRGLDWVEIGGLDARLGKLVRRNQDCLADNPSDRAIKMSAKLGADGAAAFYALPGAYRLIKRADGEYLQFSGEFAVTTTGDRQSKVSIEIGSDSNLYKTDKIEIPQPDTLALERRVVNLQKVLATKQFGSKNWLKLKSKISKIQRQIKQFRRRYQQYHAHWLTDKNGAIDIIKVPPDIEPVPVPKPDGEGNYLPNGAEQIAEFNKNRAKLASAQFVEIIKQQGELRNCQVNDKIESNPKTPTADLNSPKVEKLHGKKPKGKGKTDSSNPQPRQRNRRREKAIG